MNEALKLAVDLHTVWADGTDSDTMQPEQSENAILCQDESGSDRESRSGLKIRMTSNI